MVVSPDARGVPIDGTAFGYVGWVGHHNLGDDAIADVLQSELHPLALSPSPKTFGELFRSRRNPARWEALRSARLLLGGGTVIGRANWRLHVNIALRACRGGRAVMIGAAVEDPSFRGRRSFSSFGELACWRRLLEERFESVTVRGPRSAELCGDIGVEAKVVGDPALLATMTARPDSDGPVVVCLGYGDALRGGDQNSVIEAVAAALSTIGDRQVRAISVNPSDRRWAEALCARLGARASMTDGFELATFDRAIDGASVVIAERLHAGILASVAGFAPAMLAYQPKVDDFARSVGAEILSTAGTDIGRLIEVIESSQSDEQQRRVASNVSLLRGLLAQEITMLRRLAGASAAGTATR